METKVQQHPRHNTKQHAAGYRKSKQEHGKVAGLMLLMLHPLQRKAPNARRHSHPMYSKTHLSLSSCCTG